MTAPTHGSDEGAEVLTSSGPAGLVSVRVWRAAAEDVVYVDLRELEGDWTQATLRVAEVTALIDALTQARDEQAEAERVAAEEAAKAAAEAALLAKLAAAPKTGDTVLVAAVPSIWGRDPGQPVASAVPVNLRPLAGRWGAVLQQNFTYDPTGLLPLPTDEPRVLVRVTDGITVFDEWVHVDSATKVTLATDSPEV